MHQTAREYVKSYSTLPNDKQLGMATICFRYIQIFLGSYTKRPVSTDESWTKADVQDCTNHLDKFSFLGYALDNLRKHINGSRQSTSLFEKSVTILILPENDIRNSCHILCGWDSSFLRPAKIQPEKDRQSSFTTVNEILMLQLKTP